MTTFEVSSHPNTRLLHFTRALFPYLKPNVKVKLKKYETINDLVEALNEGSTTLKESEVEDVVKEILQIDKILINYELNILKHPNLTYIISPSTEKSTLENNQLIIKALEEYSDTAKDEIVLNKLKAIFNLDLSRVSFDFISAQLINYINSLNLNSVKIYIKKLDLHDINMPLNEALKTVAGLNEPLSGALPEKSVNLDLLNFIKNLSDFGLKSKIHAHALNEESLSFISLIDSKFVYKLNRMINL